MSNNTQNSRLLIDNTFSDLLVTKSLRLTGSFNMTPGAEVDLVDSSTFIVNAANPTIALGFNIGGAPGTETILATTQTSNINILLPDLAGTVIVDAGAQTLTGVKTFTHGIPITATTNQLILGTTNTTTISSVAPSGSRTYTIPDAGANASFVMTQGTQTIAGATTFSTAVTVTPTTNQLVLGTTNTTTINSVAPSASRVYTIPDAGAAASFVMTQGTQTIAGATTFSTAVTVTPTTNQLVLGTTNTTTINSVAPSASRTYTIPDAGAAASFVMTQGTQTIVGATTFSALVTGSLGYTAPSTSGYVLSGTLTGSAAATSITLNSKEGSATFTGQTCANAGTLTLTINNTAAGSAGNVSFTCSTAATNAVSLYMQSITWNSGTSIVVVIANSGSASTGSSTFVLNWKSFN